MVVTIDLGQVIGIDPSWQRGAAAGDNHLPGQQVAPLVDRDPLGELQEPADTALTGISAGRLVFPPKNTLSNKIDYFDKIVNPCRFVNA